MASTARPFEHEQLNALYASGAIDATGIGIPQEYPRMLYRKGVAKDHNLAEKPLKIDGKDVETLIVDNADDEAAALADGWFYTTALTKTKEQEQAEEIAQLRAQVSEQKRGPGRPPLQPKTGESE